MLVSVIMPAFNAGLHIKKSIESVLSQSYSDFELIIIDDASSDDTYHLALLIADLDPRVKVLKNEFNRGVAYSRNRGIEFSTGELICFLDSDDLWMADKLMLQIALKQSNPDVGLFYTGYELIDSLGDRLKKAVIPPVQIDYKALLKSNHLGCLTVMLDKKMLGSLRFDSIGHEDYNLWLNLLKHSNKAIGTNQILAQYRVHKSLSSNKRKAAYWRWNIYYKVQNLGLIKSLIYFTHYACSAVNKYTIQEN